MNRIHLLGPFVIALFTILILFPGNVFASKSDDIYVLKKHSTGTRKLEVHIMKGLDKFQSFVWQGKTTCPQVRQKRLCSFQLGDFNGDGNADIFQIQRTATGSGKTEVHILNGADHFSTYLAHFVSALHLTPGRDQWDFLLGDYNSDKIMDIYVLKRNGTGSKKLEVHILDGSRNFSAFLLSIPTVQNQTAGLDSWSFVAGDYNGDAKDDIIGIKRTKTPRGKSEIHILDGATKFQTFTLHQVSALEETKNPNKWSFIAGDYNKDHKIDLYAIKRMATASGKTEVHILDGRNKFRSFLLNTATVIQLTPGYYQWDFLLPTRISVLPAEK